MVLTHDWTVMFRDFFFILCNLRPIPCKPRPFCVRPAQVLVVLTHDWTVMCFDRHLKLLWESNPMKVKVCDPKLPRRKN